MKIIISAFVCLFSSLLLVSPAWAEEAPAFDMDLASAAEEEPTVSFHGYYEFEHLSAEGKNSTFDAHKLTVWMGVKLNSKAFLSSEIEYEHAPKVTGDGGGDGQIKVDSAQLRISLTDSLTTHFGIFYVPFGIEYFSYPGHINKLVTRPKVMKGGGVIPGTWSDVGVSASLALSEWVLADIYAVNGDARNGTVSRDTDENGNESKTMGARLMLAAPGLNIGASYATGMWDPDSRLASSRTGVHLQLDTQFFTGLDMAPAIIAEWVDGVDEQASSIEGADRQVGGYYIQMSFAPIPTLELVARHGGYAPDRSATAESNTETSGGVVWAAMDNVKLKMEYQRNIPAGGGEKSDLVALQLTANW
ncbi:MAG: hypothetical protein OEY50_11355 [Nitrospinota bacterium]|nr:hypothetical protein [Nitrospinota bacterium]MDH5757575.1 hypothetical protein [Nitrospinota bacterium]